jgi:hypothetical protein
MESNDQKQRMNLEYLAATENAKFEPSFPSLTRERGTEQLGRREKNAEEKQEALPHPILRGPFIGDLTHNLRGSDHDHKGVLLYTQVTLVGLHRDGSGQLMPTTLSCSGMP